MSNLQKSLLLTLALVFLVAARQAQALFSTEISIKNNVLRSGKLTLTVEPAESLLTADNMTSGSAVSNTLKINNSGTIATNIKISAKKAAGYTTYFNALEVRISDSNKIIFEGPLTKLIDTPLTTEPLAATATKDYLVTVTLPQDATSTVENSYANVTLVLTATEAT
ncbi:MAG: hypothetical protein Q7S64_02130 [bacterium]|nr:hypothetical protein [bacterium]